MRGEGGGGFEVSTNEQWVQLCTRSPNKLWRSNSIFNILVGFGRACAPVRCAHPSLWAHCHPKRGAARPPSLPITASLLRIWPPKIHKIYPTWAAHVKDFFLSTVPQRLWGPLPPVPPLPAIFWCQKYIPVRPYALIFLVFLFFSFWIFSLRYSLLFLLSFFDFFLFFSSYLFLFFS